MSVLPLWEELSELEQLQNEFSDYYKEVYGIRPRFMNDEQWNSVDWFKAQMAALNIANERKMAEDEILETAVVESFEDTIAKLMGGSGISRARALRWLLEANDAVNDPDFLCYDMGLPYGYFKGAEK